MISLALAVILAAPRVGLFVGSNGAPAGREPLQHAETDAIRLREAFTEVGRMRPEDAVLITSPDAARLQAALQDLARRAEGAELVVFYYSGHADDRALLLGQSALDFSALDRALEGAKGTLSLHVVDACRAGALTRRKGATLGAPFSVRAEPRGEGRVVIASSAEWEDSQESDRIGGSFFTLHLATALRGAADEDGDGAVSLDEAYRYVYGRTVESTLPTPIGAQHPTYRYDLRGRGEVILSWPEREATAWLELSPGSEYLVVDAGAGRVVAELRAREGASQLSVRPGRYRVSRRGEDATYEGLIELPKGARAAVDPLLTRRVEPIAIATKGAPEVLHSIWIEGGVRGPIGYGFEAAPLLRVAYTLDLPWLLVRPRLGFSGSFGQTSLETPRLGYRTTELSLGGEVGRGITFFGARASAALGADLIALRQTEREAREAERTSFGAAVSAGVALESPRWYGLSLRAGAEAVVYTFSASEADREPVEAERRSVVTYRAALALGYTP